MKMRRGKKKRTGKKQKAKGVMRSGRSREVGRSMEE